MAHYFREKSATSTSSLNKGATDSIGFRAKGFEVTDRTGSLAGGDVTVSSVTISKSSATLLQGQTLQLTASPLNAEGDRLVDTVTWQSDTTSVATVSSTGLVSVVGSGTANITAHDGGTSSSACVITVTAILTTITLSPTTLSFAHTTTGTTTASGFDQFGAAMTLPGDTAAHSSSTGVATVTIVTATGVITVTGVTAGTTNVTATEGSVTSNTCAVTTS